MSSGARARWHRQLRRQRQRSGDFNMVAGPLPPNTEGHPIGMNVAGVSSGLDLRAWVRSAQCGYCQGSRACRHLRASRGPVALQRGDRSRRGRRGSSRIPPTPQPPAARAVPAESARAATSAAGSGAGACAASRMESTLQFPSADDNAGNPVSTGLLARPRDRFLHRAGPPAEEGRLRDLHRGFAPGFRAQPYPPPPIPPPSRWPI